MTTSGIDVLPKAHSSAVSSLPVGETYQSGTPWSPPRCRDAWLAQGQHPATECVVIALFEDEDSLRKLEGRLRSDPRRGGDFFALLGLTTQPPEVVPYEVREIS